MTVHDTVHVGGVSEACKYCDHSECRAPNCSCDCHRPTPNPNIPTPTPAITGPEKACPKCGTRRPFNETYCRVDGERLASLLCGVCGSGMNVEDSYCYNCGGPKGTVKATKAPQLVVPGAEIEYEEQVLRGLQEELGVQQPEVADHQAVVERPAGTGGSFTLVSGPSPNKIRTVAPVSPQPVRGGKLPLKLPVKPS